MPLLCTVEGGLGDREPPDGSKQPDSIQGGEGRSDWGPNAIAEKALLNEIRTLKHAGKHPNIITLVGTRIEGGKSVLD
ncbi:hypothetical protein pdam_00012290 [Pocillopora damicornis]|uniref:Protein kinase domain-containing protein n=1 Tax=Pocillopora damicornis TaxID=46731 RepID=A0A3M6T9L2_POCDA|nr:hypothetical protein pdam_00012290 [Pocillopora damicornis]